MPIYTYQAKEPSGRLVKGEMEAPDDKIVAQTLRDHKLIILKIDAKKTGSLGMSLSILDRVKQEDVLNFTRQLAIMTTSGLSITQSLSILRTQTVKKKFSALLETISKDVQSGSSLGATFQKFPKEFNQTYVALIQAGEAAGLLEQILPRLADTMEKQKEFRAKTRGAFIYPAIVFIGMLVVIFIMMYFVIPKLATLYTSFGTQLPLPTLILITVSNFTVKFWWLIFLALIGGGIGYFYWQKTKEGKFSLDTIFFKIPIFGSLRRVNILTEFTRTLGLLTTSGVPIIDSLKIVARTTGSVHYEQVLNQSAFSVEKGLTLAQCFNDVTYFPLIVRYMVETGEQTGKLGEVLLKLSHFFEIEAEQKVKNLTVAMEPVIMIVLGIGVGFLILSIILPIYKLTSQF